MESVPFGSRVSGSDVTLVQLLSTLTTNPVSSSYFYYLPNACSRHLAPFHYLPLLPTTNQPAHHPSHTNMHTHTNTHTNTCTQSRTHTHTHTHTTCHNFIDGMMISIFGISFRMMCVLSPGQRNMDACISVLSPLTFLINISSRSRLVTHDTNPTARDVYRRPDGRARETGFHG